MPSTGDKIVKILNTDKFDSLGNIQIHVLELKQKMTDTMLITQNIYLEVFRQEDED